MRIEVWFSNGNFRAFPKVKEETVEVEGDKVTFTFGKSGTHEAILFLEKIDFMEKMTEEE